MFVRWSGRLRRARNWVARSNWLTWWLRLPVSNSDPAARGIVLVQIDGLSLHEFRRALAVGRLPFLQWLIEKQRHRVHRLYSGIPSSTPAFQGELFYGRKTAVPAFCFQDRTDGTVLRMSSPDAAARVEAELGSAEPLLEAGAAYCNIYSGGAAEAHFCAATVGWGPVWTALNPVKLASLIVIHAASMLRIVCLGGIELALAIWDFGHGLILRKDFWQELKFIPARVAVCTVLRELTTIGVAIDLNRGLPIVHCNLLGYDEQAHRRGPSSAFAHWTLKGIDTTIRRMWKAAKNSPRRDYDLWVYSDHGQEETIPYRHIHGDSVQEAIAKILSDEIAEQAKVRESSADPMPLEPRYQHDVVERRARPVAERAEWLTAGRWKWWSRTARGSNSAEERTSDKETPRDGPSFEITAMGPLGHLYLSPVPPGEALSRLADRIVREAHVPSVSYSTSADSVVVVTEQCHLRLPEDAEKVFGKDHPFLDDVVRDWIRLCQHSCSGDLVLNGWRLGQAPISFPNEHGAHGGPGPNETCAFALVPGDIPAPSAAGRDYLRPLDLREAILVEQGRRARSFSMVPVHREVVNGQLRVMTYNVHHCMGMDGRLSIERIARIIRQCRPDIVGLQELDVAHGRSGGWDQAREIARLLEMDFRFHPAWQIAEEQQGDAILSRLPMELVRAVPLPSNPNRMSITPRGALWARIDLWEAPLNILNTHLDVLPTQHSVQVEALLTAEWLDHPECTSPTILCGDFNFGPGSKSYRRIQSRLRDAQLSLPSHKPHATWLSSRPLRRIDHVFVSHGIQVVNVEIVDTELARVASDHLPLVVDMLPY